MRTALRLLAAASLLAGCGPSRPHDPLVHSKKLIREGHMSLYRNGAFRVPRTSLTFIPPGPDAVDLALELAGVRARQSFSLSVKRAAESVTVVAEGTRLTFKAAEGVHRASGEAADAIRRLSKAGGTILADRSSEAGKSVVGKSWALSADLFKNRAEHGAAVSRVIGAAGEGLSQAGDAGGGLALASIGAAGALSKGGATRAGGSLAHGWKRFVLGYAVVPAKLAERSAEAGESLREAGWAETIARENKKRRRRSKAMTDVVVESVGEYPENVSSSFSKAGRELKGEYRTTGLSFAVLKSMRWVLRGLLWDATLEPLTKVAAASLGYVGVNFVAFPVMAVVREGVVTTEVAVEVGWDAAKLAWDLTAPSAEAAVASVYSVADFSLSQAAAAGTAIAGTSTGVVALGAGRVAGVAVKGAGKAAGATVQYVGIPLASLGIALSGGTVGTMVAGAGQATGGTIKLTGLAGLGTAKGFGVVLGGTTLAAGTAASVVTGASFGLYELSKAVVVPAGYSLGGGMVLSYGTLSHLGAHSILAAADCAYLVLSLEGPRWVVYAVKGKVDSGEETPTGALVDLEAMRQAGEEVLYLPLSEGEMRKVVGSIYDDLPKTPGNER